jgi:hypothetical protein
MKEYTEDDLREAFYKGREQVRFPKPCDIGPVFIRPTFNGYLRELDGTECPYKNWDKRIKELEK